MTYYSIMLPRSDAALYLAWEYGVSRANKMLPELVNDAPRSNFVLITDRFFLSEPTGRRTKRRAKQYAERIKKTLAYQKGRLGKPLACDDVYVIEGDKFHAGAA